MSMIATLLLLDRDRIADLVTAAGESPETFRTVLDLYGRPVPEEYPWSGYGMLHALTYLEDLDIPLEASELDAEADVINAVYDLTVLITPGHRRLLDRLDPAAHRAEDLAAHSAEIAGIDADADQEDFAAAGQAGLDALRLLHDHIARLRDDELLLLHVG